MIGKLANQDVMDRNPSLMVRLNKGSSAFHKRQAAGNEGNTASNRIPSLKIGQFAKVNRDRLNAAVVPHPTR